MQVPRSTLRPFAVLLACLLPVLASPAQAASDSGVGDSGVSGALNPLRDETQASRKISTSALASSMQVGDVVFIRVGAKPFREVADATGSWTNHVGVVVDVSGAEPMIGESALPLSRTTTLSKFVARSEGGRVAVERLKIPPTEVEQKRIAEAAARRTGILYDTGFDLHSRRQFCSRYVREVLFDATGKEVGEVETFAHLLSSRPDANIGFWRVWYFGSIPWNRETVTPASLLRSAELRTVFDGAAGKV